MQVGQRGRSGVGTIALIGAMLLLSACQTPAPVNAAKQSSPSTSDIRKASAQPAAPILSNDSAAFIGLGHVELSRTLGQPKQVRKDAPAEVWQYSGADCVVDFYLYDSNGHMEVAFVEARDVKAEAAPTERCVKSLLQSVSTGPSAGGSL